MIYDYEVLPYTFLNIYWSRFPFTQRCFYDIYPNMKQEFRFEDVKTEYDLLKKREYSYRACLTPLSIFVKRGDLVKLDS